jgi:transmembrane sensor
MTQTPPHLRVEQSPPPDHSQEPRLHAGHPVEQGADEREFEAFAQEQNPLDLEAATWVTRRRSGLNAEGEAELRAWLEADPSHAQAFEDMDATFGDVQQLPDGDVAQLKAALPERGAATPPAPPHAHNPVTSLPRRPRLVRSGWSTAVTDVLGLLRPLMPQFTAAALAVVMLGGGWMGWSHWQQQPVFEQSFATERGQQLKVALPDATEQALARGSTLQLDTETRAQVRLYRDRREVHMHSGQAMFAVHSDAQRPLHVYAGALRITVVGTRFSVRHTGTGLDAGQTVVSVEEGRVRVENSTPRADRSAKPEDGAAVATDPVSPAVELTAGQAVAADAQGHMGPVATLTASAIAPWRDGRISFDQTPLSQAIAEFERYGHTGLVVLDPAVGALPVGGSYSLRQWRQFAETLPQVLPVRLVRRGEAMEVVAQ